MIVLHEELTMNKFDCACVSCKCPFDIYSEYLWVLRDFGWQQRYARFCGRVVVLCSLPDIISVSLGLDYNRHPMVHKCKKLCKSFLLSNQC